MGGKIKGYIIKTELKKEAKVTQQKGRRVPLRLQAAVEAQRAKLLNDGHIRWADKINEVFIKPVVITVKSDKTVKVSLDARLPNDAIQKDKYQMQNQENLMEQVAEKMNSTDEGSIRFTSLHIQYAPKVKLSEISNPF